MRSAILLVACGAAVAAESDVWERLRHTSAETIAAENRSLAARVKPSASEREALAQLLRAQRAPWTCEDEDPKRDWISRLEYTSLPLSSEARVLLVEAGPGCARGGQGANGAMWLVRFAAGRPTLLTDPDTFAGFLFSVEPASSHGLRDVVAAWHSSATETGLGYWRYDGQKYRRVAAAELRRDNSGGSTILPSPLPNASR